MTRFRIRKNLLFIYTFLLLLMVFGNIIFFNSKITRVNPIVLNYNMSFVTWILDTMLSILIPIVIILSGISQKIDLWCKGMFHNKIICTFIYFFTYCLLDFILFFPLAFFSSYFRTHILGLSNTVFYLWLWYRVENFLISSTISSIAVVIIMPIVGRAKERSWIIIGLLVIPFSIISSIIYPVFIDPMLNKFYELPNAKLESKLISLSERCGINDIKIYVVDKSKETNTMNAYMTGLFGSKRIVLWDTTLNKMTNEEIEFTTAHELGHYVLNHIPKSIIFSCISTFIILYLTQKTLNVVIHKFGEDLGILSFQEITIIPLFIAVYFTFSFLLSPVSNMYSRHMETQADKFALELTHDNDAAISSEKKFLQGNLSIENPAFIYELFNNDHPTAKERMELYKSYKPWEGKEKLEFQNYYK